MALVGTWFCLEAPLGALETVATFAFQREPHVVESVETSFLLPVTLSFKRVAQFESFLGEVWTAALVTL